MSIFLTYFYTHIYVSLYVYIYYIYTIYILYIYIYIYIYILTQSYLFWSSSGAICFMFFLLDTIICRSPYKKPSDRLFYIHSLSNHPPKVVKQIPNSIQEKLSKNSSNEEIFSTAKCEDEDAPKKIGFKADFRYI